MKTAVCGHVSAAKAPPVGRAVRGNRSSAVQVVAFRDTHRAHQLKDTACEFARELGHNTGRPWEELVDINVMTTMQEPRKHVKLMGIEAFEATLGKPARVSGGLCDVASCRVLLSAINDDTDTVFLLMGPEKPPAAGGAGDHTERVQYHLLKLDFMLDDTARRITSITHRATLHASPAPPLHHIKAAANHVVDEVVAHKVAHAWCSAATSGQEPEKVIGSHLARGFQLWDAYGMMAHMVNAPAGQQAKGSHSHGHSAGMPAAAATGLPETMSHQQAMDMLKAMQHWGGAGMATETRLLDYATALDRNAAFMHWICTAAPAATVSSGSQAKPLTICKPEAPTMLGEGMQVMLFNEDGQVTDVWMFADAMPTIPAKQHSS